MAVVKLYSVYMQVSSEFKIRRYWLKRSCPSDVIARLNVRSSRFEIARNQSIDCLYVDINYWGDSDPAITRMELLYGEWVLAREAIVYRVEGDDGL